MSQRLSRSWPKHPDGRALMVSELSDAERNLHLSRLIEELIASAPDWVRNAIYADRSAIAALRAGALSSMLITNATLAARRTLRNPNI